MRTARSIFVLSLLVVFAAACASAPPMTSGTSGSDIQSLAGRWTGYVSPTRGSNVPLVVDVNPDGSYTSRWGSKEGRGTIKMVDGGKLVAEGQLAIGTGQAAQGTGKSDLALTVKDGQGVISGVGRDEEGPYNIHLTKAMAAAAPAAAQSSDDNWPMYHRTYESFRYSPLAQINKSNVKDLTVAWVHQAGAIAQGLESTPIVIDGVMYYIASNNRVFALDGATGKEIWHYYTKLDPVVSTLFFQPYNRGVAAGNGNIYFGTLDGRVIALDMKTGKEAWVTTVLETKKCSCNFTGAPLVVKDKVIIGQTAGELPIQGKIFALNTKTGAKAWEFNTIKNDPKSWGGDSGKFGGGGGWMTGSYDPALNLVYWSTANPAPDYDWGGARPGDNLYTSSVLALDADTGQLKWYFQEIPHDDWDYDAGLGESLVLDRDGKKLLVHQNKSGFVFVYDRTDGKIQNVWPMIQTYNFVKTIDPKTGELIGRNPPREVGKPTFICPWIAGGRSWNSGSYNLKTKLWYNTASEVCEEVTVEKQTPTTEPAAGLFFGGDQVAKHPPGGEAYGHLDARDPVTGERKWTVRYKYPPIGSVLSTGGGLVFHGDIEGVVRAFDADSGAELWQFRTGSGHRGGPISYAVNGKQYIAVPSGLGSLVLGLYPALWPEVEFFPAGGTVFVFAVK